MLGRLRAELVALVAPPACVACRAPLRDSRAALCERCERALPRLRAPLCARCALPAPCGSCPARGARFERAWAPFCYDGTARALVAALKFHGWLAVADTMAAQLGVRVPEALLGAPTLVPVPAHPSRRRARGFDQADLLAEALARRTSLPFAGCLERTGTLARQLGAARRDRLSVDRIRIVARAPVPEAALLVDDVHTTGATLDACARALRASGAARVNAVTFARTLRV